MLCHCWLGKTKVYSLKKCAIVIQKGPLMGRGLNVINTHAFNGPFSGTTRVGRYQKGKTNLDFTEARYSEWQWHQLGHMQVCTSLQADNHANTPPLSFLQAGCSSRRPTNSVNCQSTEGKFGTVIQNVSLKCMSVKNFNFSKLRCRRAAIM